MKLRSALGVAAATTVLAPLALLTAPAVFADTGSSSAGTSVSESASGSASSSVSASSSESASASESESADDTTASPSGSTSETQSQQVAPSGSSSSKSSPSASDSSSASPSAEPSGCPVDEDGVDVDSQLDLSVSGLPGKIVAGSGWHTFTLSAANRSDQALGTVQWLLLVDNESLSDDEQDWLADYAKIEYFNPETKAWESIADEIGDGIYFGETELGAKKTVDIKLRLDITKKAPTGDGFTVGFGGYLDSEKNCVHVSYAAYEFTVLKPGSSNDDPGEAKPGSGKGPAGGKEPQGGADEIPATGSLASTGSDSALPMIGLVGGTAVVVGAGAVFAVRRKKAEA